MIQIFILVLLLQQQLPFVLGVEQVLLDLLLQPACRLSQDALLQFAISQSVTHSHQISPCDVIGDSDSKVLPGGSFSAGGSVCWSLTCRRQYKLAVWRGQD